MNLKKFKEFFILMFPIFSMNKPHLLFSDSMAVKENLEKWDNTHSYIIMLSIFTMNHSSWQPFSYWKSLRLCRRHSKYLRSKYIQMSLELLFKLFNSICIHWERTFSSMLCWLLEEMQRIYTAFVLKRGTFNVRKVHKTST